MPTVKKIEATTKEFSHITRPPMYTPEIAMEICYFIGSGFSLKQILEQEMVPGAPKARRIVTGWLFDGKHPEFEKAMEQARLIQAYNWADECMDIADNALDTQKARLMIETRKWFVAKLLQAFGTKLRFTSADGKSDPMFKSEVTVYIPDNFRSYSQIEDGETIDVEATEDE